MHRIPTIMLAIAALATVPLAAANAQPAPDDTAALTAFADAFDAAQISRDGAALGRMVADDLVFIDGSGKRLGKADFIAGWTGADDAYDPVTLRDRIVMPLGPDAGLASAETILSGRSAGQPFRVRIRFTDIFRRSGDSWQAAYIHVTRMGPEVEVPKSRP
ncbi:nuclear transport factor 2 family protein [Sphingopyxis witflariensis]|nr:nuclear transport factor 2 family protein [Sphingopyxis witflariensis]